MYGGDDNDDDDNVECEMRIRDKISLCTNGISLAS